jgi:O-antigen ligase
VRFPFSWWQLLWVLLFVSGFIFRVRTAADINDAPIDAWALFRIGCVFLAAMLLFIRLSLKRTRWTPGIFSGVIGVFLLYPAISLISSGWSVRPPWTLYKSLEFSVDVMVIAAIVATLSSAEEYIKLVNWTWLLLGLLAVTAWFGAVVDPGDALFSDPSVRIMALPARLVGLYPVVACNELSEISAILGLVALARLMVNPEAQKRKMAYRLLFLAAMATLIITQTRGAFAAFFIGLVLLLLLTGRVRLAAVAGVFSFLVGFLLLLFTNFGASVTNFLMRGQTAKEASGISGRGETWAEAFSKILEHPLIGYGGFAGARFVVLSRNSISSSSLNTYIDSALNIGIAGPIILLIVVFATGRSLWKSIDTSDLSRPDSYLALEMFLGFVIMMVISMESSNLITHPPLAFLAMLGAAQVLSYERRFAYRATSFPTSNVLGEGMAEGAV